MTTFPVKKGEVIEHGEGHSSTAKRDGIAYFDGESLKMLPDERPIHFMDFTLRSDHDRVTIDGKTYTTPELRASLGAAQVPAGPVAYMRRCVFEKEEAYQVRNPAGKLVWPVRFVADAVSVEKKFSDDIPLAAAPEPTAGAAQVPSLTFEEWLAQPDPKFPKHPRNATVSARVAADFRTGWDAAIAALSQPSQQGTK